MHAPEAGNCRSFRGRQRRHPTNPQKQKSQPHRLAFTISLKSLKTCRRIYPERGPVQIPRSASNAEIFVSNRSAQAAARSSESKALGW
jgi:hypothetical protein